MNTLLARLDWLWRLLMTGFCFSLFGAGGLLLSVVWFNLLNLAERDRQRRRRIARRSIAASFRFFLRVAKAVGVLDYAIDGAQTLREERGCLVVANHPTLIDYVLIASVMPETDCLVKGDLLRNPFVSGVIRAADYLINSQADRLLPQSERRLRNGDTLLIFPEGTRTRVGEPMTLQRGAANIAVRCRADLRVVTIHCSEHLLDKQSKWYHVPAHKPQFRVMVGKRINTAEFCEAQEAFEPALAARQLNRHLLYQLSQQTPPLAGIHNDASALS
ncbi:lysophospholipid acyltransferase family protein [Cronobacter turicensis]|uniref:lysophospholipid acyltransferase family protein n=1 Tax=Cronobacter turicensis TaxID=413502 RepID=UPI001DD21C04|nr:lysophospholipid acyltransferase family protein [Cronobacter turicensis]EGT4492458.1 1-acyl-sn-glycerol-3-phosphate acyltransferase [Cronobacter turicensis]MDI6419199.1 lysophospholipid acyltransferase family protein [Cronobacter turicensis]MDI6462297.1 lysophospholipid acyltransferase family protein [Cronobacter turicensis]MDI7671573.1 lysophospholipid acyltransferase family protein [Cronobacter turicensis]